MADGSERFWSGDSIPEDAALEDQPQGGPMTLIEPQKRVGCQLYGTNLGVGLSCERLSVEVMMNTGLWRQYNTRHIKL